MSNDVAGRLERFFEERRPEGVVAAYLFGSRAEGRAHRESDVDVGVLVRRDAFPTRLSRSELRVSLGSELISVVGVNQVDLVILNDAPPELGRRIAVHGRRVYCADAEADHAYRRDIQLRAADLAPFLRRTRRVKLQNLAR